VWRPDERGERREERGERRERREERGGTAHMSHAARRYRGFPVSKPTK